MFTTEIFPRSQLCISLLFPLLRNGFDFLLLTLFSSTIQNDYLAKTSKNVILFGLVIISKIYIRSVNEILSKTHAPCKVLSVNSRFSMNAEMNFVEFIYKVQRNFSVSLYSSLSNQLNLEKQCAAFSRFN